MQQLSEKEKHWYRKYKGLLKAQGVSDADSLDAAKHLQLKIYTYAFWASIFMFVMSIPLIFLIIGIPMFLVSVCIFFYAKKMKSRLEWGSNLFAQEEFGLDSI